MTYKINTHVIQKIKDHHIAHVSCELIDMQVIKHYKV
jgi:hypothetical protein